MSVQNAQLNQKTLDFVDMKTKLTHKFLYGADSSAMQLLLNLYDLEEKIHNIFPSYVSIKNLKKDILSFLRRKDNRAVFANSLTNAIYDDINRFELVMYLAGYKCGYNAASEANELEVITLRHIDLCHMFERKVLFHYDGKYEDVRRFRKQAIERHLSYIGGGSRIKEQAQRFSKVVLKRKVLTLNHYVDRQLQVDFLSPKKLYRESDYVLTREELIGLNRKLKNFLYRDGLRIYLSAYWCGINDSVLRRYHP
ncbi:hypothetical protein [Aedoeadaptatus urinae]|uniref:hypothetical protein n=1 Tax=Aedoeadaptatus urinae TaxID=1871017 RepID=UPI00097D5D91|nr:hypothetical protein [Peptoniphilus urinae]